jgi:hypothetical protein
VQAFGTVGGRELYFRARHENWTFDVADRDGNLPMDGRSGPDGFYREDVCFDASFLPFLAAVAIIARCLNEYTHRTSSGGACGQSGGRLVTEAEWLNATDFRPLLEIVSGNASARKLRLFAVAWCRHGWHWFTNGHSRRAVEVSEDFADGLATEADLRFASELARHQIRSAGPRALPRSIPSVRFAGLHAAATASAADAREAAGVASCWWGTARKRAEYDELDALEGRQRATLLRDIFGNPFRPAPALDPGWLAWNDFTAGRLAQSAYDERSLPSGTLEPARLSLVADALEDAGCSDAALLGHLRDPGPHWRGCWALDLVLAKG